MDKIKNIICIGAGYVGGPTMVKMAQKHPELNFQVVDINEQKISAWNSDSLPVYQPGLLDIVKRCRNKNLFFTVEIKQAIEKADIIFIAVQTPTKNYGDGNGQATDLSYWLNTAKIIKEYAKTDKIIVEKSTVPIGTASFLNQILNSEDSQIKFHILSNPEFLAEGTAMEDLEHPDRILIGSMPDDREAEKQLVDIYSKWVPREKIITSNIWSAQLSKLAANAFLAQRVSSINSIAALCQKTGADITQIAKSIGSDSRIGNKFLKAGPGFGGSCFKKDINNLIYLCRANGLYKQAQYWQNVINLNQYQPQRIITRMLDKMMHSLCRKIAVFGYSFKADTGDTRETPSKKVIEKLLDQHAEVTLADPKSWQTAESDFKESLAYSGSDFYKAAENTQAIVIMTDWKDYDSLDWNRIFNNMSRYNHMIFDYRNCLDRNMLEKIGFTVFGVGK